MKDIMGSAGDSGILKYCGMNMMLDKFYFWKIKDTIYIFHLIFLENSRFEASTQLEDYRSVPSDNNSTLRSFYSRAPAIGGIDSDDTSDDEFILYVDDDKKHILMSWS